jgi:hypothetical protein
MLLGATQPLDERNSVRHLDFQTMTFRQCVALQLRNASLPYVTHLFVSIQVF